MNISSIVKVSLEITSEVISYLPLNLFWSRRKGDAIPGILNWSSEGDSSSLVSDITKMSTFRWIWSTRPSVFFLNEFIFKWAKMTRRKFFWRTDFKMLKVGSSDEISSLSDLHYSDSTKQLEKFNISKIRS